VKPFAGFDAEKDAGTLKGAMKGFGCNNEEITNVLGNRTANQRHEIAQAYKNLFGRELIDDLKSELGGNFERLVIALMYPWPQFCARVIKKACKGAGTDEDGIVDILCTATNCELKLIKDAYKIMEGDDMEDNLKKELSGDFQDLIVAVLRAARHEEAPVDVGKAKEDAQKLLEAGELKLGTDESTFTAILVSNSYEQLKAIQAEYKVAADKSLIEAAESELSGAMLYAVKTILGVANNKLEYFANRIHDTMAGLGTDDKDLINLIVLRSEVDLGNIMETYAKIHEKSLAQAIEEETSGDYKKLLLDILY